MDPFTNRERSPIPKIIAPAIALLTAQISAPGAQAAEFRTDTRAGVAADRDEGAGSVHSASPSLEVHAGRKFLAEPKPTGARPALTPELAEIFGVRSV